MAGKGDRYRPVDQEKYDRGWDLAFGNKETEDDTSDRQAEPQGDPDRKRGA